MGMREGDGIFIFNGGPARLSDEELEPEKVLESNGRIRECLLLLLGAPISMLMATCCCRLRC